MNASQMEGAQSPFLPGISGPRLAAVQQCADNTGVLHSHLGRDRHLGFVYTLVVRRARVVAAFPIHFSISLSRERLSVMVDPR